MCAPLSPPSMCAILSLSTSSYRSRVFSARSARFTRIMDSPCPVVLTAPTWSSAYLWERKEETRDQEMGMAEMEEREHGGDGGDSGDSADGGINIVGESSDPFFAGGYGRDPANQRWGGR